MSMSDLIARGAAAQGMMGSDPTGMPSGGPPVDEGPLPPAESQTPPDIGSALDGVDAALDTVDPKIAEEARTHLNAIRELVSQDTGGSTGADNSSPEGATPPPEPGPPMSEEQMPS